LKGQFIPATTALIDIDFVFVDSFALPLEKENQGKKESILSQM